MGEDAGTRRVALITGASRQGGIAAAVASHLARDHDLLLTGLRRYDAGHAAAGDRDDPVDLAPMRAQGAQAHYLDADLSQPSAPAEIVGDAIRTLGRLDALVVAHAHSSTAALGSLTAAEIDAHLAVNVRATLLLVEAFVRARAAGDGPGRIVLLTSGQRLGPMPSELAYVAGKGAVDALVLSLADALAETGTTVNAVNPGPTDTGWLAGAEYEAIRSRFPGGRWGTPEDAARVVAWLLGEDASWVTGQIISSEGGFRR